MVRWFIPTVVAALMLGCGNKAKPVSSGDTQGGLPGSFVDISFDEDEELDALFGSELMIATAQCGDLVQLEPAAMMGKLKDPEIRCLDQSLRQADRQTVKDKISRVLLADAWAKGDAHRWEGIARRHLEEIDRSDPDMCYKFARYLLDTAPDNMDECMKWADVALDNRARWTGDLHVKRVYALYKLKASAAHKKWTWLEEEFVKAPSFELEEAKKEARNLTKTLAREWLEYARSSGRDTSVAMQLCSSAAGTMDFCDEQ